MTETTTTADQGEAAQPLAPGQRAASLHLIEGGDGPDGLLLQFEYHGNDGEKDSTSRAHNVVHYFATMLGNEFERVEKLAGELIEAGKPKVKLILPLGVK